jgi:hypothetical protein
LDSRETANELDFTESKYGFCESGYEISGYIKAENILIS